jgi:hypothetical protein
MAGYSVPMKVVSKSRYSCEFRSIPGANLCRGDSGTPFVSRRTDGFETRRPRTCSKAVSTHLELSAFRDNVPLSQGVSGYLIGIHA